MKVHSHRLFHCSRRSARRRRFECYIYLLCCVILPHHSDQLLFVQRVGGGIQVLLSIRRMENSSSQQPRKKTITFVTGNKNKLAEVQRLLSTTASSSDDQSSTLPFDIINHKLDLPELQGTPEDIAREKCKLASTQLQTAVFTEDTCLCFSALNNLPGPYIKWFLEGIGLEGLNKLLVGFDNNQAYAQTIIAFSPGPDEEIQLFDGRTEGYIVPARGSKDFGWDPIFEPTEQGNSGSKKKTYAEMSGDEKDAISHRGRAFRKFREYLMSNADNI